MIPSLESIQSQIPNALSSINLNGFHQVHSGKVRDTFEKNGKRIIVTTDRQSAFDRILTSVPFKGQVLNSTSAYWFEHTKDIVKNHLIATPDPAVSIVHPVQVFPVEFIIRGFMTGSTDTSVWKNYEKGVRDYCGISLPEGMKKNEPFPKPIITPTTKPETGHDELISAEEIVKRGLMTQNQWDEVSEYAMQIFLRGQQIVAEKGLILVDTKFEFGRDANTGEILLVDEVLTPDSSRYWLQESYETRLAEAKEPESFDKEFLRLWYADNCDPYADADLPDAPPELVAKLSQKYMAAYEMITGKVFDPATGGEERIQKNLDEYFSKGESYQKRVE
jgi:phosphoribosylaminoimidazole-succinocarboxamide synthase